MTSEQQKEKSRERQRRYRLKDQDAYRRRQREWYAANPEKALHYREVKKKNNTANAYAKKYREANREKVRRASSDWTKRNRDRVNIKTRERFAASPSLRAERSLRNRLYATLKRQTASRVASAPELVGCSIAFLVDHLSSMFKGDMSWSNYGSIWEIDHRRPCSSFDLTQKSNQVQCFHWTNLQPLLISDNRRKHAKIIENLTPILP